MALTNLNTADFIEGTGVTQDGNVISVAGGGGGALDDLTDVVITTPSDGQVLTYDSGNWVNETPTGGGVASVTGDGVDNTDPDNPVLSYPTPSDIGAWSLANGGTLTGNNVITGTGYTLKKVFNSLGVTQTNGYGLWLANETSAANNSQQLSPSLVLEGRGWKTTATAESQSVKFGTWVTPVQGASNPSATLNFAFSINNNAYLTYTTLTNFGQFTARYLTASNSSSSFQTIFEVNKGSASPVFRITQEGRLTSICITGATVQNTGFHSYSGSTALSFSSTNQHSSFFSFTPTITCSAADTTSRISLWNFSSTWTLTSWTGTTYGFYYNPTLTNNATTHVAYYHGKGFIQWDSVLSPAQITSDQNDYNPTGFTSGGNPEGASILRLESDAMRDITGLVGGVNGRLLIISNVGSNIIRLMDEDAGSAAANRFTIGTTLSLTGTGNKSVMLWYDGISQRWRTTFN
jgi:hypothetical protein